MKDYSNYREADCCDENKELRYKRVKRCSLIYEGRCTYAWYDKLTGEIIYDPRTINLCELIAPIPPEFEYDNPHERPIRPPWPRLPEPPRLDPLTIDPDYLPTKFDIPRIEAAEEVSEETGDWTFTDSYDRIGNKHGRWFLNAVNKTEYELYELYSDLKDKGETDLKKMLAMRKMNGNR